MAETWQEIIAGSQGEYSMYCSVIGKGVTLEHRPDVVLETASTIKLPILLALLDAAQRRQISLRKRIDLNRSFVGRNGSGILESMYFNAPFTLYNLAVLMMSVSDTVATNAIIGLLGKDAINRYIKEELGLKRTKLVMSFVDFAPNYGLDGSDHMGLSTARELGTLLGRLIEGKVLDPQYTRVALRMMGLVYRSTFIRRLPSARIKRFGSKTGWIDGKKGELAVLTECGFIEAKSGQKYSFAVISQSPLDPELPFSLDSAARIEFARLGRALFDALEAH